MECQENHGMGVTSYEPYMILSHCAINDFVPHLI